ncbi:hypothetical protein L484_002189 [Morus notabilis]|uniref:OVATE domain-containing protein n=1 Tax=Morus notabilis TaxID=981085 RepID=W9RZ89_9ROSA|nr:uncharacterized protein LOC21385768 [Morus notabilis]EXB79935.1 hypothetical protein L484_002189 [Morus notabilis]
MLLRNSISNTRKFFQRTLGSLKSFFSGGSYQKLPKSPVPNSIISYNTTNVTSALDMNIQWGSGDIDPKSSKRINKTKIMFPSTQGDHDKQDGDDYRDLVQRRNKFSVLNSSAMTTSPVKKKKIKKNENMMERRHDQAYPSKVVIVKRKEDCSEEGNTRNFALLEKRLKELEMLDLSNVDHVLDIEEVLHYYSRLTCPAYLEIVDTFFMEIFAEFFGSNSTPVRSINSRLRSPRSVMIKS